VKGIHYPWRRRIAGGWLEELSPMRLLLAILGRKRLGFLGLKEEERARNTVADKSLLLMLDRWLLFMGRVERKDRVKRQKMKCHI